MFELFTVPVALTILLVSKLAQRRRMRRRVDRDLDAWAQALGMMRAGNELFGERHGVPVGARLALEKVGHSAPLWTLMASLPDADERVLLRKPLQ